MPHNYLLRHNKEQFYLFRCHKSLRMGNKHLVQILFLHTISPQMIIAMHRAYVNQNARDDEFCKIVAIRHAIAHNPAKKWTLEKMAALSGYSVSRFSELYRKLYDISPINDVIAHRISLAKVLLLSGQTSVSYVASACGFNTVNYFSKFFKASTGYAPSEYIRYFNE